MKLKLTLESYRIIGIIIVVLSVFLPIAVTCDSRYDDERNIIIYGGDSGHYYVAGIFLILIGFLNDSKTVLSKILMVFFVVVGVLATWFTDVFSQTTWGGPHCGNRDFVTRYILIFGQLLIVFCSVYIQWRKPTEVSN